MLLFQNFKNTYKIKHNISININNIFKRNIKLVGSENYPWSGVDLKEAQRLIDQISNNQVNAISQVVPWFLQSMPVSEK